MNSKQAHDSIRRARLGPSGKMLDGAKIRGEDRLRDLIARAQGGDDRAREQCIMSVAKMCFTAASKHYLGWHAKLPASYEFDDCFAAGIEGALRALQIFDLENRKAKFSTFAMHHIENRVRRAIYHNIGPYHIPERAIISGDPDVVMFATSTSLVLADDGQGVGLMLEDIMEDDSGGYLGDVIERLDLERIVSAIDDHKAYAISPRRVATLALQGYTDKDIAGFTGGRVCGERVRQIREEVGRQVAPLLRSWRPDAEDEAGCGGTRSVRAAVDVAYGT